MTIEFAKPKEEEPDLFKSREEELKKSILEKRKSGKPFTKEESELIEKESEENLEDRTNLYRRLSQN